jgi:Uncharacterized conserved protein
MRKWLEKGKQLKTHIHILYCGIRHPAMPWYVKVLTALVIAYVLSPIDLIPDFIPVLGLLDEMILVPVAFALIVRLIPAEVMRDCQDARQEAMSPYLKLFGILMVAAVWLLLIVICSWWLF